MFITFEGIDGSGKTTLMHRLAKWLHGIKPQCQVLETREPGGTEAGNIIRKVVLDLYHPCDKAKFLLYMADRAEHVERVLKPALAEGQIVLCDRFSESTYAYQPDEFPLWDFDRFTTNGLMPNLIILLDVSPETACERIYQREENPPSEEEREFLREVRRKYLERSRMYPYQYKVIDAEQGEDKVSEDAKKAIKEILYMQHS